MKPSILKIATVLGLLSWSSVSFALNANSGQNISLVGNDSPNFNIGFQTGVMNGETAEQVFVPGRMVSELKWDFQNVVYVGGVVSAELWERVYLNAGYWTDVTENLGDMVDSDYLGSLPDFRTHLSTHDADLTKWEATDCNVGVAFLKFGGDTVSSASPFGIDSALNFQAIFGYRTDEASWSGENGYYYYPGAQGMFTGKVIDYERKIHFPYIGLGMDLTVNKNLGLNLYYLRSIWVRIEDDDTHVLRDLNFKGSMDNGYFQALGANLRWKVWRDLSLNASVSFEDIKDARGSTVIRDLPSNDFITSEAGGSEGVRNQVSHVSAGVSYQFG